MNNFDLIVLFGTLLFIVSYGVWKTRKQNNLQDYLLGGNTMRWGTIGLSVMATQASAITFISTPGQAYESGMGFVQNYFGLPIALIVVSAVFIPIFYKLKVFTAYQYLEKRFNAKTRYLGAFLFLIQRGLAAGITIYAPAIIVSSILQWDLTLYHRRHWYVGNYLYSFWWDKSRIHYTKTANVCHHDWNVHLHFLY